MDDKGQAIIDVRRQLDFLARQGYERTLAIVLTWNSQDFIDQCLESLRRSQTPVAVLVVDNMSSDGTVVRVSDKWKSTVTLLRNRSEPWICRWGNNSRN